MYVYGAIILVSFAMAMATCYTGNSQLPWWALIVAIILAACKSPFRLHPATTVRCWAKRPPTPFPDPLFSSPAVMFPFVCVIYAITGFKTDVQQLAQMLGAAVVPGNSQANMCKFRCSAAGAASVRCRVLSARSPPHRLYSLRLQLLRSRPLPRARFEAFSVY